MNSRRKFLQASAAVAAVTMAAPLQALAGGAQFNGVIYTRENQGRWAKKAGSHAPKVEISGRTVRVQTKHPMSTEHFIVRHTLVQEDGQVIGATTFNPAVDKEAVSSYELPAGYTGKVFVTSFCNKHDFWLTEKMIG